MNQLIVKGAASSNDYYISDHGDMLAKEIEARGYDWIKEEIGEK